jgi:hypothetical protein
MLLVLLLLLLLLLLLIERVEAYGGECGVQSRRG